MTYNLRLCAALFLAPLAYSQSANDTATLLQEVIRINTEARPRALQYALLVPLVAGLIGLVTAFRMVRIPEPIPLASAEGLALG